MKTADGAVHGLRPGRALQGWRLLAVDPTGAAFASPAGRVRLAVGATAGGTAPAHVPAPAAAAPPAAPPPASAPEATESPS